MCVFGTAHSALLEEALLRLVEQKAEAGSVSFVYYRLMYNSFEINASSRSLKLGLLQRGENWFVVHFSKICRLVPLNTAHST